MFYSVAEITNIKHELEIHYNSPITHIFPEAYGESETYGFNYYGTWRHAEIRYTNEIEKSGCGNLQTHCYLISENEAWIEFKDRESRWGWSYLGCNADSHEKIHIMGYSHDEMLHWFVCDNP